jgi:hypothetical protein
MPMEEIAESTQTSRMTRFKESLVAIPHAIDERLPTMDKNLDRYFDANMSVMIDEWGLITQHHLDEFEHRLESIGMEIRNLEKGRAKIEKRAADLDATLKTLEGS